MDAHEDTPRIEVLSVTDTGCRRRWTDDENVRIVEESHRDGETVAEVARRHEISESSIVMETLFFIASKLFWLVARPESWIVLLLVFGIWHLRRGCIAAACKVFVSALLLILIIGFVPVGQLLILPLEMRFPAAPDISEPKGIIILGGGEDARMSAASGLPEFNAAGERLMLGLALAQEYPEATLIFTGGSASLVNQRVSGADGAQALFARFEIADNRITLEPAARNTAENATRTYELVEDATRGPWVLVTSAFHMPRSVGSFCAAGWRDMIPYPVDYRAADFEWLSWSFAENLDLLNIAVKEWSGLVAYSLTGRTSAWTCRGLVPLL